MISKTWTGKSFVSCIEPEPAQKYQGGRKVVEHDLLNKMYGLDVKIRIWTELSWGFGLQGWERTFWGCWDGCDNSKEIGGAGGG